MIAFSGLDGSGKSTQIDSLKYYFFAKNKKIEIFWSRGGYTPGINFLKQLLRSKKSGVIPLKQGKSKERDNAFKKPIIRKLWLTLAIFDLILFYAIVLRFKNIYKTIVCDRYLFDTRLDFELNFPGEKVSYWWLWKFLELSALKPSHHFVLTIPVEESQRRSKLKDEPFPDSAEVLEYRLNKYLENCKKNSYVHHINCTKPIEEVEKEIISKLEL